MSSAGYTIYIRVPLPRADFVDPPPIVWNSDKQAILWRNIASEDEINWEELAASLEVDLQFLIRTTSHLIDSHNRKIHGQLKKAIPTDTTSGIGNTTPKITNVARQASLRQNRPSSFSSLQQVALQSSQQLPSPHPGRPAQRGNPTHQPIPDTDSHPTAQDPSPGDLRSPVVESNHSIGDDADADLSDSSSDDSSSDQSTTQSRIFRRPPMHGNFDDDDDDDDFGPAFHLQPGSTSHDLGSTLRGDSGPSQRPTMYQPRPHEARDFVSTSSGQVSHSRNTSDFRLGTSLDPNNTMPPPSQRNDPYNNLTSGRTISSGNNTPSQSSTLIRKATENTRRSGISSPESEYPAVYRSSNERSRTVSRTGGEDSPSIGSSYSDLDADVSVSSSVMAEAMASNSMGQFSKILRKLT